MNAAVKFPLAEGADRTGVRRAAVIGAGSMGSGIAAQFANAGIPVDLLDVAGAGASSRHAPALAGIDRQLKAGGFMLGEAAGLVRPGNIDDDLARLADADWIVEAIVERLDAKRDLYRKIDAVRRPGSIVSSNTSTIPRAALVAGMGETFGRDFLITHFFNPPRSMQLVEIVSTPDNDPAIVKKAKTACEVLLGKTVVECRDTPGFIANRIGCHWLAVAAIEAIRSGLTVEEADAVMASFGVPRTGVFGLLDLIGIDIVPQVWGSLMATLPAEDDIHAVDLPGEKTIRDLIAAGRFGRKAKAGFYRLGADRSRETLDLVTGDYRAERPVKPADLPGGGRDLAALLTSGDRLGTYAWAVLSRVIIYTAEHASSIASDIGAIDTAMSLGYAWRQGPFQLADAIGISAIENRLAGEARTVPALLSAAARIGGFYDGSATPLASDGRKRSVQTVAAVSALAAAKKTGQRLFGNEAASLWDLGDGVACLELHTKMNSVAPAVFDAIEFAVAKGGSTFEALVIGNDDARAFCVGADLAFIVGMLARNDRAALESYIARGQDLFLRLKYAPFPVVAAAHGFALGGGCEIMLHADAIVAHAELAAGLPEVKVGLVPAWGGCTQLLLRAQQEPRGAKGPAAALAATFATIFGGAPSGSALEARASGLLRTGDRIAMHRGQLIGHAKRRARELLAGGYKPPARAQLDVAGLSGLSGLTNTVRGEHAAGRLTQTDLALAETLAGVLSGGGEAIPRPKSEEEMMTLEREALMQLAGRATTRQRMEHMLATGKPLRN
jgi:3-hydroxyacyl-CoA dehydrogenase